MDEKREEKAISFKIEYHFLTTYSSYLKMRFRSQKGYGRFMSENLKFKAEGCFSFLE